MSCSVPLLSEFCPGTTGSRLSMEAVLVGSSLSEGDSLADLEWAICDDGNDNEDADEESEGQIEGLESDLH